MFDYSNFFTQAYEGVSGMSFDFGTILTFFIAMLIIIEALGFISDIVFNEILPAKINERKSMHRANSYQDEYDSSKKQIGAYLGKKTTPQSADDEYKYNSSFTKW